MRRLTKNWNLYDWRACGNAGTDQASCLVSCDSDKETMTYSGGYGDVACYSYDDETQVERWEWDWLEWPTESGSIRRRTP